MVISWEELFFILPSVIIMNGGVYNMLKSIYKITNKVNGKCYIGQTNDISRRFREHRALGYAEEENKLLYKAINKYGLDNFIFEILEQDIENYNEREIYWIAYYHAYGEGYNMTPGGEEPPIKHGEEHQLATHTQEEVNKVIDMLLNTEMTVKEIAEISSYNVSSIVRINNGALWHDDSYNYPLRKELSKSFNEDRALKIIDDLLNTTMTQREIAEKYGVGRSTVTAINLGQNNKQDDLEYPIRDKSKNRQSKPILMLNKDTGKIIKEFQNSVEAARFLGDIGAKSNIRACANGISKTSHGYKWKFKE